MSEQPSSKQQLNLTDRSILLIAEGCGLGRIPVMPGTFGSLWGLPLGWLLGQGVPVWGRLGIGLVMFLAGIPLCGRAARLRGSRDPGSVVWDEIAVFPLVYAFVPINWQTLIAGFVLFRVFDISKPPPIRAAERLGGGLGIMVDDTIAAFYTVFVLLVLVDSLNFI
ncbi:MAG: phosphatidylglycerophosphatase A [Fuerstiella sp.]|nr:phosphatidylglycerophosphatase A [Fuerstiella sp.]